MVKRYTKRELAYFAETAREAGVTIDFVKAEFEQFWSNPHLQDNEYLTTRKKKRVYCMAASRAVILHRMWNDEKEDKE